MKDIFNTRNLTVAGIIIFAALSRVITASMGINMNFSPIMALALFGGAYLNDKKLAFSLPLASMFLSDIFIGFHPTMWAVYLSFALAVYIGRFLNHKVTAYRVLGASLAGSILFFIVTNFAYFLLYCPMNIPGLTQCYVDAIPFFRNSLAGDLIYSAVFFGSFELAGRFVPQLSNNK
jgi:hypothetical protein